jgi:hypothetical protein
VSLPEGAVITHIEKPGQSVEADTIFFLCGQFCTLSKEADIQQPGVDFVSLPGPWPEPPTCERCVAATKTTARSRRKEVTT